MPDPAPSAKALALSNGILTALDEDFIKALKEGDPAGYAANSLRDLAERLDAFAAQAVEAERGRAVQWAEKYRGVASEINLIDAIRSGRQP